MSEFTPEEFEAQIDKMITKDFDPIPADVYELKINGHTELKRDKNDHFGCQIEFEVVNSGDYDGRRIWDYVTLEGHSTSKNGIPIYNAFRILGFVSVMMKRYPDGRDNFVELPFYSKDPTMMIIPDGQEYLWDEYLDLFKDLTIFADVIIKKDTYGEKNVIKKYKLTPNAK